MALEDVSEISNCLAVSNDYELRPIVAVHDVDAYNAWLALEVVEIRVVETAHIWNKVLFNWEALSLYADLIDCFLDILKVLAAHLNSSFIGGLRLARVPLNQDLDLVFIRYFFYCRSPLANYEAYQIAVDKEI